MKKGVQLYAVRALASRDMEQALKTAADIGYEGVEFAGFFEHSAKQIKEWLDKYGLEAASAHIAAELITDHAEETIAFHKEIGNSRIACPGVGMKTREDVLEFAKKLIAVAPLYKEAGMKLFYHNHSHEFEKDNGECFIDILAEAVPADILELEFDVYWVYCGKQDPIAYLNKYKNRVSIFHAKDGKGTQGTTLGEGAVDIKAVFEFAKANNMEWAIAESEASDEEQEQVKAIAADYAAMVRFMG